jgi:polyisoprenoid-binding protein YceI
VTTASTPAVTPQVHTWTIDPSHSLAEFSVRHMMVSTVKGRFTDLSGSIVFNPDDVRQSSVTADVKANSVTTSDEQRDAHLRSADFFDAEQFPTLRFLSTRIEQVDDERVRVIGQLTIRDTTHEVVLDAELNGRGTNPWGKEVIGFSARTSINRKDFGLNWNVALEAGGVLVSDTIKISLEIEATA